MRKQSHCLDHHYGRRTMAGEARGLADAARRGGGRGGKGGAVVNITLRYHVRLKARIHYYTLARY